MPFSFGDPDGIRYAAVAATRPRALRPFTERSQFASQTALFESLHVLKRKKHTQRYAFFFW